MLLYKIFPSLTLNLKNKVNFVKLLKKLGNFRPEKCICIEIFCDSFILTVIRIKQPA